MILIFIDSFRKSFYTEGYSTTSVLSFVLTCAIILLPFFASNATLYFWKDPSTYYDTPIVELTPFYEIYVNDGTNTYFHSGFHSLDQYFPGERLSFSVVERTNYLDKESELNHKMTFRLNFKFDNGCGTIRNIKVVLFFKYGLDSKVRFLMNSIGMIDIDTPEGFRSIKTIGDLKLKQKSPIPHLKKSIRDNYYGNNQYALLGMTEKDEVSPFDIVGLFEYYQKNNYTTYYDYKTIIRPAIPENENNCELEAEIDVPIYQKILYHPSLYELIKNAWVQYFFLFLIIYAVIRFIMEFLLDHKLFSCTEVGELINF